MPTMKLESKVKGGSKEIKKYDAPRSPYRDLLESEALPSGVKVEQPRCAGFTIRFIYNTISTRRSSHCGRPSPPSPLLWGGNRRLKVTFS
jgi:hypothetical protein